MNLNSEQFPLGKTAIGQRLCRGNVEKNYSQDEWIAGFFAGLGRIFAVGVRGMNSLSAFAAAHSGEPWLTGE